jgi:hypothetical protein
MYPDTTHTQLSYDYSTAASDLLAGSARGIKERQAAATAAREQEEQEREELRRKLADSRRALNKRVAAELRSQLTPAERARDRVRPLRRFRRAWFAVTIPLALLAMAAAVVGRGPKELAALAGLYIAGLVAASRLARKRAERLASESDERVHEHLDRVRSSLPAS